MGIGSSKENHARRTIARMQESKHHPLFYRAVNSALAGSYTVAELYFGQAINAEAWHHSYAALLKKMSNSPHGTVGTIASGDCAADLSDGDTEPGCVEVAVTIAADSQTGRSTTTGRSASLASIVLEAPLPVGENIGTLFIFNQKFLDIQYVYIACNTPRARKLAMVYAQISATYSQLELALCRNMREDRRIARKTAALDGNPFSYGSGTDRTEATVDDSDTVDLQLDLLQGGSRYVLCGTVTNYSAIALEHALGLTARAALGTGLKAVAHTAAETHREHDRVEAQQRRIYTNILASAQGVFDEVMSHAMERPDEFLSLVLANLCPTAALPGQDAGVAAAAAAAASTTTCGAAVSHHSDQTSSHASGLMSAPLRQRLETVLGNGQTYLVESRELSPATPLLLPLDGLLRTARYVAPPVTPTSTAAAAATAAASTARSARVGRWLPPAERLCWRYTGWVLGPETDGSTVLPGTCPYSLVRALPEHYTAVADEGNMQQQQRSVRFSAVPLSGKERPSADAVQILVDYAEAFDASPEMIEVAAKKMVDLCHAPEAPNMDLDVRLPRCRFVLHQMELCMCLLPLLFVVAKAQRELRMAGEARNSARVMILLAAMLAGPDSPQRFHCQYMSQKEGLL